MRHTKVIIMGAAGRDFHNFNTVFRTDDRYEVVAFTATQIPNIEERKYPAELAGKLYPNGIPIFPESELPRLIKELNADEVVFAYSDVSFNYVMSKAALVMACGADFKLQGAHPTMLKSKNRSSLLLQCVRAPARARLRARYVKYSALPEKKLLLSVIRCRTAIW